MKPGTVSLCTRWKLPAPHAGQRQVSEMRPCRDCGTPTAPRSSGAWRCASCEVARVAAWRAANRDKHQELNRRHKAKKAGKPFTPAAPRPKMTDEVRRERKNAARRISDKPGYVPKKRGPVGNPLTARNKKNKRRLVEAGAAGSHTIREFRQLQAKHGGLCAYCKQRPGNTRDHIIPLSRGGTDFIGNILPACQSCNSAKRQRTITEWRLGKWPMDMVA
jgi:5-methylcytosine-specific restriction endonuclease McrA